MSNQANPSELNVLEGERGIPSVNEHGPSTAKRGAIVFGLLLFSGVGLGIGYWKYQQSLARKTEGITQKDLRLTSAVPARTFSDIPPQPDLRNAASVPLISEPGAATAPTIPGAGPATKVGGQPAQLLDKSGSSLMVGGAMTPESNQNRRDPVQRQPEGQAGMTALLTSTSTPPRSAGTLGNRNFILAKGSFIDCALQTKLDSTVPGMTACVITRNIYSDNGKVLLMERGSTVTGEYQSNMRQGTARIFVLWNRIKTPNGIVISLDSPGTDPLGGAGLPGYIDNHFWQRFGGALMLSLVDDVARGITTSTSGGGQQNFNFGSTGEATQNMAAEALKNTINIPPTLYKNQGEQVGIYVARDLNFSSVYDVTVQ